MFALNASNGAVLFSDQSPDLNAVFNLGLGKPHHAGMNSGVVVATGMVYATFGNQNNPSGGLCAYELSAGPMARNDMMSVDQDAMHDIVIRPLENDSDPNGDALQIVEVAGNVINGSPCDYTT